MGINFDLKLNKKLLMISMENIVALDQLKKWSLALVIFGSLIIGPTSFAAPKIQHWTTENGARVYFVPAPELPMVDIQVVFDAGGARNGDQGGIAHLTNTLLDDGAGDYNADQIAEEFEGLGARLGMSAHRDMAVVSLRSLTDETLLNRAIEMLKEILIRPTFPADSLERERNQMLLALRAEQQQPSSIASKAFMKAVFGDHPYGRHPLGTIKSVKTLTRDDVVAYYQHYYVAKNAVIAVVGAIDRNQAENVVADLVSELPAGDAAPPLPKVKALDEEKSIHIGFPSSQTHVLVGQPGMTRDDPDYFPLYVGNHVLGGSGLVSRISEEVREKRGLSYSAYSYFSPMRKKGPYTLGLQTKNEQTDEALKVLLDTLNEFIENGPSKKELKASKQNITGGFPLRISSNSKIVGNLSSIGFYGLPLDYLDTFNAKVEAVTVEDIKTAFKRRIDPHRLITITVGGDKIPNEPAS
ncbi:MAG: M16 family metallopeptidase [Gammaproteobacteria bacterium]